MSSSAAPEPPPASLPWSDHATFGSTLGPSLNTAVWMSHRLMPLPRGQGPGFQAGARSRGAQHHGTGCGDAEKSEWISS